MKTRPNWDEYFLNIAYAVSLRSTCIRRGVGCVIVDDKHSILATGYNGVAPGRLHCNHQSTMAHVSLEVENINPYACEGANSKSGEDLDKCEAIHAEQNALLQCSNVWAAKTLYTTTSPCVHCLKMILRTGINKIVFSDKYYKNYDNIRNMWLSTNGNKWKELKIFQPDCSRS